MNNLVAVRLYVEGEDKLACLSCKMGLPIVPIGTEMMLDVGFWLDVFVVITYEVFFPDEREDELIAFVGTKSDIVVDMGDEPIRATPVSRETVEEFLGCGWEVWWEEMARKLPEEAEELMMRAMGNWRSDPVHDAWQRVYEIDPWYAKQVSGDGNS